MVGSVICGYCAIGRPRPATAPPMSMTSASTMAKTGRSMKKRAIAGV
jgi:hypothetical protein